MNQNKSITVWLFFSLLVVLQLPAIWYSFNTPFQIVDDVSVSMEISTIDTPEKTLNELKGTFAGHGSGRFMPVWQAYTYLTYALFGANEPPHHAARLLLKLIAVIFSLKLLLLLTRRYAIKTFLPAAGFLSVFLFFPNNPEARLVPQEPLLVLFLSVFLYLSTVLFLDYSRKLSNLPARLYACLFLSFVLMLWSKENGIFMGFAALLILTAFNYRLPDFKRLIPLLLVFVYTAAMLYVKSRNSEYGVAPVTHTLIIKNVSWYTNAILLRDTSPLVGILLACTPCLCIELMIAGLLNLKKSLPEKWKSFLSDDISILYSYVVLMALTFYCWLCTAFLTGIVRYFYPFVYLLSLIIGISIIAIEKRYKSKWVHIEVIIACVFFIGVNYYNFLYQYASQYVNGIAWKNTREKIIELKKLNNRILVAPNPVQLSIRQYFTEHIPLYHKYGDKYLRELIPDPQTIADVEAVGDMLDSDTIQPSTIIVAQNSTSLPTAAIRGNPNASRGIPEYSILQRFEPLGDLKALSLARKISGRLQLRTKNGPFAWYDAGAFPVTGYGWGLYRLESTSGHARVIASMANAILTTEKELHVKTPDNLILRKGNLYFVDITYRTEGKAMPLVYLQGLTPPKLYIHKVIPMSDKFATLKVEFNDPSDVRLEDVSTVSLNIRNIGDATSKAMISKISLVEHKILK